MNLKRFQNVTNHQGEKKMSEPNQSASYAHLPVLGLTLTAVISWVIPTFGLIQPFIVDDPGQIVREFQSDDAQDASAPDGTSSTTVQPSSVPLVDYICPLLFDTPQEFQPEAVIRLKSARLYPSIGPPHTSFLV